ncbi:MmpS family transport accessory protein [Saccharothrix sp.]|uniref:MmpS family transport accessory protein n=1 Tax=Saccharothrix sp. TaxID=1873460 RepID=UPI0028119D8E|nr:MmpS family transport accessory protein [Saccharothrix sp.]
MSQPQPPYGQQPSPYGHQYAPPPPPPAPKKKSRGPLWVGIGVALLLLIVLGSVLAPDKPATTTAGGTTTAPAAQEQPAQEKPAPAARVVLYEVLGSGTANNITYTTDGLTSTEQVGQAPLPWSKQIELPPGEAMQFVSIVAQAGKGTTEITARITVDGKVVKEGKSSGQYAVVTVNENIGTLGK